MPPRKGWAAVYCRLSKEDEEKTARESESIRNQRALLLAWAAEHGYRIYRVYTDEDYSGIDRARPGFNAMLADARAGKFEVILAKTQSRFTRDVCSGWSARSFCTRVCARRSCWRADQNDRRSGPDQPG